MDRREHARAVRDRDWITPIPLLKHDVGVQLGICQFVALIGCGSQEAMPPTVRLVEVGCLADADHVLRRLQEAR